METLYLDWSKIWSPSPIPNNETHDKGKWVKQRITELIESGVYRKGMKLPPIRVLAEEVNLSPKTAFKVYRELANLKYVSTTNEGTFVSRFIPFIFSSALANTYENQVFPLNKDSLQRKGLLPTPKVRHLLIGNGDPYMGRLPLKKYFADLSKDIEEIGRSDRNSILLHRELVINLKKILAQRGIVAEKDQFLLLPHRTALFLTLKAVVNPDDVVIVDSREDYILINLLKLLNAHVVFCGSDANGIKIDSLLKACKKYTVKLLVVRPSATFYHLGFQSDERRDKLVEISGKYKFSVISIDDNFGWWHREPLAPLLLRKHSGNIIYIGPLNKLFEVTDTLEFVVGHRNVISLISRISQMYGIKHELALEVAASRLLLKNQSIDDDTKRLQRFYKSQLNRITKLFYHYPLSEKSEFISPSAGLYASIKFKSPFLMDKTLLEWLERKNLFTLMDNPMINLKEPINGMLLGFARTPLVTWEELFFRISQRI